jgi:hypothetical protein
MKIETFEKAIEIRNKIFAMKKAKAEIESAQNCRLTFVGGSCKDKLEPLSSHSLRAIDDILYYHKDQICNEIDEEIEKLYKDIEEL